MDKVNDYETTDLKVTTTFLLKAFLNSRTKPAHSMQGPLQQEKVIEKESTAKKEKVDNDKSSMLCLRDEKHMSFS